MADLVTSGVSAEDLQKSIYNLLIRAKVLSPTENYTNELKDLVVSAQYLKFSSLNDMFTHVVDNPKQFTKLASKVKYRFRAIDDFRKNYPDKPSIDFQDVIDAETGFNTVGVRHNAMDVLTPDLVTTLIGNGVDAVELNNRFDQALDNVRNADEGLKKQLFAMFPGANTVNDLQKAMLLGKEAGVDYLKNKVATANVMAGFGESGFKSVVGAEELAKLGVTRQEAAQGAIGTERLNTLSKIYEGDLTTENARLNELSAMGADDALASRRRAKLTELEKAKFSGTSGVGSTSFTQRRAGQL